MTITIIAQHTLIVSMILVGENCNLRAQATGVVERWGLVRVLLTQTGSSEVAVASYVTYNQPGQTEKVHTEIMPMLVKLTTYKQRKSTIR